MKKKVIEFLTKKSIKKYAGKLNSNIPYEIQDKISAYCPYSLETDEIIKCELVKEGYGCHPTKMCIFQIGRR